MSGSYEAHSRWWSYTCKTVIVALALFLAVSLAGLVIVSPPLAGAVAVFVALVLIYLRLPILAPVFFAASEMIVHPITNIGSLNIFLSDVIWIPALVLVADGRRLARAWYGLRPVFKYVAMILVFGLVSTLLAAEPGRSLVGLAQFLEVLAVTFITLLAVRRPRDVAFVLVSLFLLIGFNSLLAAGQLVNVVPIPELSLGEAEEVGRVTGLSANALGTYLVLGLVLAIVFLCASPWRKVNFTFLVAPFMALSLVATGIRSAWFSLIVALPVLAVIVVRGSGVLGATRVALAGFIMLLFIAIVATSIYVGFGESYYEGRTENLTSFNEPITGSTTYARLQFWKASLQMIESNPLFGVGLKNWVAVKYEYGLPSTVVGLSTDEITDPHHKLLELASERGVLGMLAYLSIYVVALRKSWWGFTSGRWPGYVALPLVAVSASRPIAELVGGDVGSEMMWFMLLGLVLAMSAWTAAEGRGFSHCGSGGLTNAPSASPSNTGAGEKLGTAAIPESEKRRTPYERT